MSNNGNLLFYYTDNLNFSTASKFSFGLSEINNIYGDLTDKRTNSNNMKKIGHFEQFKICNPKSTTEAYVSNMFTFFLKMELYYLIQLEFR